MSFGETGRRLEGEVVASIGGMECDTLPVFGRMVSGSPLALGSELLKRWSATGSFAMGSLFPGY
jgi:hypothetical protein